MAKKRNTKAIITIVILIVVFLSVTIKRNANNSFTSFLRKIDKKDALNHLIRSKDLKRNIVYLQFINPNDSVDIDLFKKVYSEWQGKKIKIIIITNNFPKLRSEINEYLSNIIVLNYNYDKYKEIFKAPKYGTNYLFDESGHLVYSGRNYIDYEQGIRIKLNKILNKQEFNASYFIKINQDINELPWLQQILDIFHKNNNKYLIFTMHASLCAGCASGQIVNILNDIYSKKANVFQIICILHNKFNNSDIANIKRNLGLQFPIYLADKLLNEKWSTLIEEYGETNVTNIVALMDKSGKVIDILYPNCNRCLAAFFNHLYELLNSKKTT
jgi:hypothetical protein